MNLQDLRESKKHQAVRALKEHFGMSYDLSKLDARRTRAMLTKVQGLINETRASSQAPKAHNNPAYLKLMMMEQMLSNHWRDIKSDYQVVVENEEIDKSQVLLAAQSMVDELQNMLVKISKMNVEELPSVVSGIESEIDSSKADSFEAEVGGALASLQQAIDQAKSSIKGAIGGLTGQGGDFGGADLGAPEGDLGADLGAPPAPEMGDEMGGEEDLLSADEEEPAADVGRGLR